MDKTGKMVLMLVAAGWLAGLARAEFGISADATRYRAKFNSPVAPVPWAHDPGAPLAGIDHFYEDGYNRVDSSANYDGMTSYWGYQDRSQYDPRGDGTITMNSSRTILEAGHSAAWQDVPQTGLAAYWQQELAGEHACVLGWRTTLRWQRFELDERASYGTSITTISDRYSLGGGMPVLDPPFDGSFTGPNCFLDDDPLRTEGTAPGPSMLVSRAMSGDLVALDVGPTLSVGLADRLRAVFLLGVTTAWVQSRFAYRDGTFASGRVTDQQWLVGGVAGVDLQYRLGEHWGIFGGAAATVLQDFEQQLNGHTAALQFDKSLSVRTGLFFQ
jgi:hypothetical protein